MKTKLILGLAIAVTITAAFNNNRNKRTEYQNVSKYPKGVYQTDSSTLKTSSVTEEKNPVSIKEIVSSYLIVRNAFTKDNAADAAKAGEALQTAFKISIKLF